MSDDDLMDIMKDRNPDLFKFIQSKAVEMDQEPEPMVEKGFIGISPEEVQEEELI